MKRISMKEARDIVDTQEDVHLISKYRGLFSTSLTYMFIKSGIKRKEIILKNNKTTPPKKYSGSDFTYWELTDDDFKNLIIPRII